jgi:hypothetical protein
MANYHFDIGYVSRGQGRSPARLAGYQARENVRDNYFGKLHDRVHKQDVIHTEIFLTPDAPIEFADRQTLMDAIDRAEKRSDSRTLRTIIASLPNELTPGEWIELVRTKTPREITLMYISF